MSISCWLLCNCAWASCITCCAFCRLRFSASASNSRSNSCLMDSHCARARRTNKPVKRAALGKRSGPKTTRATTAIRSSSLKPISNKVNSPRLSAYHDPVGVRKRCSGKCCQADRSVCRLRVGFLNSLMALPISLAPLASRLVPNTNRTMTSTTSQWRRLKLPMICSLLPGKRENQHT